MSQPQRRIVLAEDDALVRVTVGGLVAEFGYAVTETASGAEALAALEQPTDLLITDLNLPDMSGLALAAAAVLRQPRVGIIIASGELNDGNVAYIWLTKPFTVSSLRSAIERAMPTAPS